MQKEITNVWKIMMKLKSYIQYWDVNKLYGWAMSQKLPINNFEWTIDTSQLNEDFIINYYDESDEGYFLEVGVQYLDWSWRSIHNDLSFLPDRMKIEKSKSM